MFSIIFTTVITLVVVGNISPAPIAAGKGPLVNNGILPALPITVVLPESNEESNKLEQNGE